MDRTGICTCQMCILHQKVIMMFHSLFRSVKRQSKSRAGDMMSTFSFVVDGKQSKPLHRAFVCSFLKSTSAKIFCMSSSEIKSPSPPESELFSCRTHTLVNQGQRIAMLNASHYREGRLTILLVQPRVQPQSDVMTPETVGQDCNFKTRHTLPWGKGSWPKAGFTPFHSQEWSVSNFPCSLTRNSTSHSMKNLTFHRSLRWSMNQYTINYQPLNNRLSLQKVRRTYFLSLRVKG